MNVFRFSSSANRTNNAKNSTHNVKLDQKRKKRSKRNYYIISWSVIIKAIIVDLPCKRCSVGQPESKVLIIPRSSVQFRLKPEDSNSYGFELHRPSIKDTKLLLRAIKAIIIIIKRVTLKLKSDQVLRFHWASFIEKSFNGEVIFYREGRLIIEIWRQMTQICLIGHLHTS